ncbi:zinc knuckle transcription factor (CnjB) [Penicillium cataractarum]|uniref:Zinc knuckle transcription factor (CnjB) n=1 Tax=Penicillium cataractarum TaxID=2100454 RepID=A0A9W9SMQ2_9EURO|nr:zinc knuckle transcription factor (CnjB) [Penicillium cataractarum]KAJ5380104.1 zinc knuckle transcription factor (CnjB) [Penicillium cataractarum]
MSSVWDAPASGDAEWDKQDGDSPETGDAEAWTSTSPGKDNDDNNETNGNDENVDPHASEYEAHDTARDHGDNQDFTCRNCGETGHFARQCPNAEVQKCFNCDEPGHSKADCPNPPKPRACFSCGEEGHSKADCPNPAKPRACFNCGEEGHNKADCPKPRVFKGACRICAQEGHPASACPEKPADICNNCGGEGHLAQGCTEKRKFDLDHIADKLPDEAWAMMKQASDEKDMDDFREAIQIYTKAVPQTTYVDIEKKMREEEFKIFLIALEKEREDVISLIDLQGQLDCEFVVGYYFSDKPMRANLEERWPRDAEDNLERLANAGLPYDRKVMKCRNCGEMGHGSRACKEERAEVERLQVKCGNCGAVGHRVRDCPEERRSQNGCRNCGEEGHEARDCTEPRSTGDVECRRCNEVGHFAKDCPNQTERAPRTCRNCGSEDHIARDCDQPPNPDAMICRNCDQTGHMARDCPEPKNWSKIKCNRCGEMGHTVKRCPQPEEGGFDEVGGEDPFSSQADDVQADNSQEDVDADQAEKNQDDADQDDEVEKVRQRLDDQFW